MGWLETMFSRDDFSLVKIVMLCWNSELFSHSPLANFFVMVSFQSAIKNTLKLSMPSFFASWQSQRSLWEIYDQVRVVHGNTKGINDVLMMHCSLNDREIGMILASCKEGMKLGVSGLCEDTRSVSQAEKRTARTAIPKSKITCRTESFVEDLKQMGISSLWWKKRHEWDDCGANKGLYVSQIIHKTAIEIDEHGSEAAAATRMIWRRGDGSADAAPTGQSVHAEQTFPLLHRHRKTATTLCCGHIDHPLTAN